KQRFGAIDFGYPDPEIEAEIVAHESRADVQVAARLVRIGKRSRNLKGHGLDEGASTRMLIQAGRLIARGVSIEEACQVAMVLPITDDPDIREALTEAIAASL
ncbi:MAG: CbbQ/NirQ/NorQ C-terminal domain-containing protein, partial [Bauldia sp.]|nr:CbbQ/NirQ/NorQ C-terminal domain-containing protein [Bauldia sp.]